METGGLVSLSPNVSRWFGFLFPVASQILEVFEIYLVAVMEIVRGMDDHMIPLLRSGFLSMPGVYLHLPLATVYGWNGPPLIRIRQVDALASS